MRIYLSVWASQIFEGGGLSIFIAMIDILGNETPKIGDTGNNLAFYID